VAEGCRVVVRTGLRDVEIKFVAENLADDCEFMGLVETAYVILQSIPVLGLDGCRSGGLLGCIWIWLAGVGHVDWSWQLLAVFGGSGIGVKMWPTEPTLLIYQV
jgi:hypothetical protein